MATLAELILESEKRTLNIDGKMYFATEEIYQFFLSHSDKQMLGAILCLGLSVGDITLVK